MIVTDVRLVGDLEGSFVRFGETAPALAEKTVRLVAYNYRRFIQSKYLSGQVLEKRTGTLKDSISVGRKKMGGGKFYRFLYWVGPKRKKYQRPEGQFADSMMIARIFESGNGFTIAPKERLTHKGLNRASLVFKNSSGDFVFAKKIEDRQPRPFMGPSVKAFPWDERIEKYTESVIRAELKKLAKEGNYVPGGLE